MNDCKHNTLERLENEGLEGKYACRDCPAIFEVKETPAQTEVVFGVPDEARPGGA